MKRDVDYGSFELVGVSERFSNVKKYIGLSADISKLPVNVGTGSIAFCVDTSEVYMFEFTSRKWYKLTSVNMNF